MRKGRVERAGGPELMSSSFPRFSVTLVTAETAGCEKSGYASDDKLD